VTVFSRSCWPENSSRTLTGRLQTLFTTLQRLLEVWKVTKHPLCLAVIRVFKDTTKTSLKKKQWSS